MKKLNNRSLILIALCQVGLTSCQEGGGFSGGVNPASEKKIEQSGSALPLPNEDRCEFPSGIQKTAAAITGEDWPDNAFDKGGADNDDYTLSFSGNFLIEPVKKQIGTGGPAEIKVSYSKDVNKTPCSHKLVFKFRRCPTKDSFVLGTTELDAGRKPIASAVIPIPEAAYLDISLITTSPEGNKKETNLYETQGRNFVFK